MVYSEYYHRLLVSRGIPKLGRVQTRKLLNIISLECRINDVVRLQKIMRDNPVLIRREKTLRDKLFALSGLEAPFRLIEKMELETREENQKSTQQ